jgi:hypothetical protein
MDDLQTTDDRPDSYRVTADELRQFIERFERLEAENATSPTSRKRSWPRPRRAATTPR